MPYSKRSLETEKLEDVSRKAELNLIFVKLGGTEGVAQLSQNLFRLNSQDSRINMYFDAAFKDRFERMFVRFMTGILGGDPYNRRSMVKAHRRIGALTDEHFDAFQENLSIVLKQHGLITADHDFLLTQIEPTRNDVIGKSTCPHLNTISEKPSSQQGCACTIQ
ncbi:hypothetical protein DSO57_1008287 [Entomophthora muscae]|uniref:Uncharacterized protein n=1 Tax=Entomophthora muscae TaxID=34485 RepID=A0ACC2UT05_9FUNG|nr:hypothetical protein DSO57_1008287 [Entomophthora muscae]